MENSFRLCQGVDVDGTENLKSCFKNETDGFTGILSAEKILPLADLFIDVLDVPLFFFLELPDTENEDKNNVFFLDNCTPQVAHAILKRYGTILSQDGISNFGFGSNKTGEEIYFREYQEFMIYAPSKKQKIRKIFDELELEQNEKPVTMWDLFTEENEGCLTAVESDGETVFDIPVNLRDAGMYKSE